MTTTTNRKRGNGSGSITFRAADERGSLIVKLVDPTTGRPVSRIVPRLDGERHPASTKGASPAHIKRAKDVLAKLRADTVDVAPTLREGWTLSRYIDERYLPAVEAAGRKPATINGYQDVLDNYVRPALGDIKLADIHVDQVDDLDRSLAARGLSITTRRHARSALNRVLRHAVRKQRLKTNVCDHADELPERDNRRVIAKLSTDDVRNLLTASQSFEAGRWEAAVALGANGLRRGEIVGLRWQDVDLAAGTLTIRRNLVPLSGGKVAYNLPKSATSARTIAMTQAIRTALTKLRLAAVPGHLVDINGEAADLILVNEAGQMVSPHNLTAAVIRLTKQVLDRAEGPHELRHYAATELLKAMSPADVAYHLGHASAAITLSVYASPSADASTQAASFLDAAVGE